MKLSGDLMNTEVMSCSVDAKVNKVAKIMRFTNESYIPLVSDTRSKKVVGSLTDRDLIDRVLSEGRHPNYTFIKEIITDSPPVTCGINAPVDFVLSLMSNNGITNVLVVDRQGCLLGVISLADIMDHYQYEDKNTQNSKSA